MNIRLLPPTEYARFAQSQILDQWGHACYRELHTTGTFNAAHFQSIWEQLSNTHTYAVFIGEDEAQHLQGAISGFLFRDPFTGWYGVQEVFWYLHPEARSLWNARALLLALEGWALEHQAHFLRISAPYAKHSLGKLLQKHQYQFLEQVYEKSLCPPARR